MPRDDVRSSPPSMAKTWFIRHFRERTFPSGRRPRHREGRRSSRHAAPGVNGHGKHGPQPNPQDFFPLHPTPFRGGGGQHNFRGGVAGVRAFRGFRGSSGVGWKGRESSLQSLAPKFPEEPKTLLARTLRHGPQTPMLCRRQDRQAHRTDSAWRRPCGARQLPPRLPRRASTANQGCCRKTAFGGSSNSWSQGRRRSPRVPTARTAGSIPRVRLRDRHPCRERGVCARRVL